ncbi:MBL fold metallo-hydrolase [Natrinema salsiterrestre]|uniref:MBL fold metallo-hydrolase n=1 Tax=Natrinema salsiterrestre TaxID=2950540 RepID=A0A9Q4L743_9EURY|nr:MBL fold metallo-hydrolase [Natrinema salsiterrestre]MDF9746486.1 MBL fold metallo-hydrolase [Natrinema salsiterrestre]
MTGINPETPWIPADADQTFDPLEHADVRPSPDRPLVVTPRGGDREVGRSCYQVDTEYGTYLVDCGLNQGEGDDYPDFRGLEPGSVDAVFLTHAHIDHCGGLPVLEARGFLDDDAPIIATRPTVDLAKTLLEDSLKIHRREANRDGKSQRFTQADVSAVFDRFQPVDYGGGRVEGIADAVDRDPLVFQLGNAAHLLGSAWLVLQTGGYRVVFSGDLGGRADHLPDITPPPQADLLFLESTYGATHSHTSFGDAQTTIYEAVERALNDREPVLIPTFAVGRSQTLQLLFSDRLHTLPGDLSDRVRLVVDGMAQEATALYHEYVTDAEYMSEAITNRARESGDATPFSPPQVEFPESDADRRAILEDADPSSGGKVPIIVSPSGMLTGGNSPRYLVELASRFHSATVLLTGYQAQQTVGRTIQNQVDAGTDDVEFTTDATPFGTDWPAADNVTWITTEGASEPATRVTIPAEWVTTVGGLSGHAAQHGLLEFARTVDPETIALIHGPDYAQEHLGNHLATNVDSVDSVTRSRRLTPIAVEREGDPETAALSPEMFESEPDNAYEQLEDVFDIMAALNEEVAAARTDTGRSEADVRDIVRDELERAGLLED